MTDTNAKVIRFPWTAPNNSGDGEGAFKGFLSMKLGTYKFLFPIGLPNYDPAALTKSKELQGKTYERVPYPGCAPIQVTRKTQIVTRTLVKPSSTAESEKKLILSEVGSLGESQDTIHYTGPVHGAVAFLTKLAVPVGGSAIQISGPRGQDYGVIKPVTALPTA
jgi:hypothetical protein